MAQKHEEKHANKACKPSSTAGEGCRLAWATEKKNKKNFKGRRAKGEEPRTRSKAKRGGEKVVCALPEVHEEPAAGVGRVNPPISADLLPLELVARLRQSEADARHAPDGARVKDGLHVHELGEISSIVPAVNKRAEKLRTIPPVKAVGKLLLSRQEARKKV